MLRLALILILLIGGFVIIATYARSFYYLVLSFF